MGMSDRRAASMTRGPAQAEFARRNLSLAIGAEVMTVADGRGLLLACGMRRPGPLAFAMAGPTDLWRIS